MSLHPIRSFQSGLGIVASNLATDPATRLLAIFVILANAVAIGGPAAIELGGGAVPRQFDVMTDQSFPEMFNYAQEAACVLLLAATFARTRQALFLGMAVVFAAIGLDDALSYHERFGGVLVEQLSLPAIGGLRAQDTGELMAWIIEGAILVPLLLVTARRASIFSAAAAWVLLSCIAGLAVCGAGLDMLHILINTRLVGYLEDGGEMLFVGAACVATFAFYRTVRRGNPPIDGTTGRLVPPPLTHS